MHYIIKIMELVNLINQKFNSDEISARLHMTRHEIKVQVFDNGFVGIVAPVNERVRYFNDEKAEPRLRELHLKLHNFIEDMS